MLRRATRPANNLLTRQYTAHSYDTPNGVFKYPKTAELIASAKSPERIPALHGLPEVCSSATYPLPKTPIHYWNTLGYCNRARELREIKLVQRGFGTSRVVADEQESCTCSGSFFRPWRDSFYVCVLGPNARTRFFSSRGRTGKTPACRLAWVW